MSSKSTRNSFDSNRSGYNSGNIASDDDILPILTPKLDAREANPPPTEASAVSGAIATSQL